MTKHTPGPWRLKAGYRYIISAPGDGFITRDVCRLDSSTMAAFAQDANARLICEAPKLFQALEMLESTCGSVALEYDNPIRIYARQVLAAARGDA